MIHLDLTEEEAAVLITTIRSALSELHTEISHTDSHDYKEQLRIRQHALEKALQSLEAAYR